MVLSGGDRRGGEGDEVRKSKCERCQQRRGGGETFVGSPIAVPQIPETSVNAVSPGSALPDLPPWERRRTLVYVMQTDI